MSKDPLAELPYTKQIRDKIIDVIQGTEMANSNSDQVIPSEEFFIAAELMKKEIIKNVKQANL